MPADVPSAEPLRDVTLGRHLTEVFGADDVRRYDADDVTEPPRRTGPYRFGRGGCDHGAVHGD
ncbi:hypothetical protein [Streptomyces sp. KR80]|uniref:hypothetical protein n=1 Tax=Streptomyces sp. KR80 TaxID=3457426 RepID=UPI003FCF549F